MAVSNIFTDQKEINNELGKFYDKNTGIKKFCNTKLGGTQYAFNRAVHE